MQHSLIQRAAARARIMGARGAVFATLMLVGLAQPALAQSFATSVNTPTEGDDAVFEFKLPNGFSFGIRYSYETVDDTATGTANNGTDYTSKSGYLTFPANTTTASVTVATLTDSDDNEGNEYFGVKIHSRQTKGALTNVQGWTSSQDVGFDPNEVPAEKTVTTTLYDDTTAGLTSGSTSGASGNQ